MEKEKVLAKEKEEALQKSFAQIKAAAKSDSEKTPALKETKKAVKKPAEKKEAKVAVKSEPVETKAEPAAKEAAPAKKAPAKTTEKTTEEKTEAAAVKTAVTFEFNGKQIHAKDVLHRAMETFQNAHKDTVIESFEIYIVADKNAAYYVVNGVGSENYRIDI